MFLNRPSEHLQRYENILEAICKETAEENPDRDYLTEAAAAFKSLQGVCHLQTFQHAMGRGPTGKYEWFNLVSDEARADIAKKEQKRQACVPFLSLSLARARAITLTAPWPASSSSSSRARCSTSGISKTSKSCVPVRPSRRPRRPVP